jgi:ppGpp synthetase/RelA/SpoT-type nucleotidyltranferase
MKFDEYEKTGHSLYGAFARLVCDMLEDTIAEAGNGPQSQSIQQRRKTPASLKAKLIARGNLDSAKIEEEIKVLAAVRIIFYTNANVDKFLQSRLILQLFKVQWNETRIHYPTEENDEQCYEAFHYTVSLTDEMVAKPEFAKFAGLRCEIQIQTILDHAWAETYHEMVYKAQHAEFGVAAIATNRYAHEAHHGQVSAAGGL